MLSRINQYFDGKSTDDEILYRAEISRKQLREVLHHYEEYVSAAVGRIIHNLPLHSCKRSFIPHNALEYYLVASCFTFVDACHCSWIRYTVPFVPFS